MCFSCMVHLSYMNMYIWCMYVCMHTCAFVVNATYLRNGNICEIRKMICIMYIERRRFRSFEIWVCFILIYLIKNQIGKGAKNKKNKTKYAAQIVHNNYSQGKSKLQKIWPDPGIEPQSTASEADTRTNRPWVRWLTKGIRIRRDLHHILLLLRIMRKIKN